MTVSELLDRMSSREFSEWMLYYELEPFGEERADLRQAMTTSAVHNSVQVHAKYPKWTKPADFMPFGESPDPQDPVQADAADPAALRDKFVVFAGKRKVEA